MKHLNIIISICEKIKISPMPFSLYDLAKEVGMSPGYFQKIFKKYIGVTPKQYALAHRQQHIKEILTKGQSITSSVFASGHGSTSRFYEKSNHILGMTPTQYKQGGKSQNIMVAVGECSLGSFLVAQTHKGICAISLGDEPDILLQSLQRKFPYANFIAGQDDFDSTVNSIVNLIDSGIPVNLPWDIKGTTFQQKVWHALCNIPLGTTMSYGEIAQIIGLPKSSRAVANACGANPLAVLIPCHRVIQKNGDISGYRWGIERKHALQVKELAKMLNRS